MFKFGDEKGQLKCSFCGKAQEQVKKLIAGPGVYICDECIELCNEIIDEELNEEVSLDLGNIPKPKEIKTILDGGLEAIPENVLFYATSNRKHLIPTKFSDNDSDEIRPSDTVEEKVSLVDRFGLRFGFYHFSQETYLEIVAAYARKYGVRLEEQKLDRLAIQWATQAGGRNGRTAEQFVRSMLGEDIPADQ